MKHTFTDNIIAILRNDFKADAEEIFNNSHLIQYLNYKTRSANKGSKSRSSFANLYAIYVLVEDYLDNKFDQTGTYSEYEGSIYNKLFARQRQLPFGGSLQNHALNNRMNAEFKKYFPTSDIIPILRKLDTNRYWINENLLKIKIGKKDYNLANVILKIIEEYTKTKQDAFDRFIRSCEELKDLKSSKPKEVVDFIAGLLAPNVDARLFEIVSFSILKYFYHDQNIYWGFEIENLSKENLKLYKTGRTNANDGGIDFVMKPLGRFFQVTETLDFKKYFLDIDKIQKFPITFVVKSDEPVNELLGKIKSNANKIYLVKAIVEKYMSCIEEVINIQTLNNCFAETIKFGYLDNILDEIILQSKVEFNYSEIDENDEE